MKYVTTIERMAKEEGAKSREVEIALNMLQDNLPLDQIARLTGLTIEQVQQLQVANP